MANDFVSLLGGLMQMAQQQQQQPQSSLDELRRAMMQRQMQEAQGISNAVPRGQPVFQWQPPAYQALPELPTRYQPPQYWNYGKPVRIA